MQNLKFQLNNRNSNHNNNQLNNSCNNYKLI